MGKVPSDYLLWLFKQPWIKDWPGIHKYLVENQDAFLMEQKEEGGTDGFTSLDDYERYGR